MFSAHRVYTILLVTALFVLGLFFVPRPAHAVISSCTASVSPTTVTASTTQTYTFTLGSVSNVLWIRITRPSDQFTVNSGSANGWNSQTTSYTYTTFTPGGTGSTTLYIEATSGSSEASSANWTVQVSDDSGGASPTTCTGSLGTAISGAGADTTPPTISSLVVSDITDSGARITWTTDESSNTAVDYGTSDEYGSTVTGDNSVTSHSVTISGLSANTTYHYNAKSTDSSSNTAESGDNTFATAKSGYTGTTVTGTVTTVTKIVGPTPTPTPVPDRTPPRITLTTKFEKFFTKPPVIEGRATDPSGVASVEYSMDNGENFLPVDELASAGKATATFSFVPYQSDDGNYTLIMRAVDAKGNSGKTKGDAMVIDRLPPVLGPYLLTVGPQIISPVGNKYRLLTGLEYKLTLAAVGGPTDIALTGWEQTGMKKNPDNGLWSVPVRIDQPGEYEFSGVAADGAGNRTVRSLGAVTAEPAGMVQDTSGAAVSQATVTVYYLDRATRKFMMWDGLSYGQHNPMPVNAQGQYAVVLPPGTFYVSVTAPSFRSLVTDIFTVTEPLALSQNFRLERKRALKIGPWMIPILDFRQTRQEMNLTHRKAGTDMGNTKLIGSEFPFFRFPLGTGQVSNLDLRGKPAIVTFLNSWSPNTASQLSALADITRKSELQTLVIIPMESAASVATFARRGGYAVRIVADPDGTLVSSLGLSTLPTHVTINRKGIIQVVLTGLATKEELLDTIMK